MVRKKGIFNESDVVAQAIAECPHVREQKFRTCVVQYMARLALVMLMTSEVLKINTKREVTFLIRT